MRKLSIFTLLTILLTIGLVGCSSSKETAGTVDVPLPQTKQEPLPNNVVPDGAGEIPPAGPVTK